jgi:hypothetical protein
MLFHMRRSYCSEPVAFFQEGFFGCFQRVQPETSRPRARTEASRRMMDCTKAFSRESTRMIANQNRAIVPGEGAIPKNERHGAREKIGAFSQCLRAEFTLSTANGW